MSLIKEIINKKIREIKIADTYAIAAAKKNGETFKDIKGCNVGKEVVLCGSGPTLAKYRPIESALHVAINSSFLNDNIKFEWLIVTDWGSIQPYKEKLEQYNCIKFFGHQIPDWSLEIPESYLLKVNGRRFYTDSITVGDGFMSNFECDIDCVPVGNMPNIALTAMQIILFSNPKRIYLVGCDASSTGHFNEENKSMIKNIYVDSEMVFDKWRELKKFAETFYPDTEIISINPVGLKGFFVDEYTE